MFQKLLLSSVLLLSPFTAFGFLGEDLGLDMYKQIDEGFYELERQQYEYELSWQGQWSIQETVTPFLNDIWVDCDISSPDDIEIMLWNTQFSAVEAIFNACSVDGQPVPNILIEAVRNELAYIKNIYRERAEQKALQGYKLARMWIYSDGSLDNSPFDLMYDLEEIDRIIFSEDIIFQDVPVSQNSDNALSDFLTENWDKKPSRAIENLVDDINQSINSSPESEDWESVPDASESVSPSEISTPLIVTPNEHNYVCLPEDANNGLGANSLNQILWNLGNLQRYRDTDFWLNTGWEDTLWDWSNAADTPRNTLPPVLSGTNYSPVTDEFGCDWFFCITVETKTSNYGTVWANPISIQSIFSKVAEHLEKPANTSLTQRKMATNNFEISSIITNLSDMFRGFGIQVQTKPVPILELAWDTDDETGPYATIHMLEEYYKNAGLDYHRQNDLDIFEGKAYETKIFQTSAWMSIVYPEVRNNELIAYQNALSENNRIFSQSLEKKILQDDTDGFIKQFSELEGFVASMEDFSISVWYLIDAMKKIPSRSS